MYMYMYNVHTVLYDLYSCSWNKYIQYMYFLIQLF